MKCFTIEKGGKLLKYVLPQYIATIATLPLRKKERIAAAHPDFTPSPCYTLAELRGLPTMYSYGALELTNRANPHSRTLPKTGILLFYRHSRFFPDERQGDKSIKMWTGREYSLICTWPKAMALRDYKDGIVYEIDAKHKIKSFIPV